MAWADRTRRDRGSTGSRWPLGVGRVRRWDREGCVSGGTGVDQVKIVWTNATEEQLKQDYEALLAAHKKALKEELTWDWFGGTITINGRTYQVA